MKTFPTDSETAQRLHDTPLGETVSFSVPCEVQPPKDAELRDVGVGIYCAAWFETSKSGESHELYPPLTIGETYGVLEPCVVHPYDESRFIYDGSALIVYKVLETHWFPAWESVKIEVPDGERYAITRTPYFQKHYTAEECPEWAIRTNIKPTNAQLEWEDDVLCWMVEGVRE